MTGPCTGPPAPVHATPATGVRLSYLPDPHGTWDECRRLCAHATAAGYGGIWMSDHLAAEPPRGPQCPLEAFSTLGALAATLDGARLGSLVSPVTYRPAPVLAAFAATMTEITNGRFVLGIGLGGSPDDHAGTGLAAVPPFRERLRAVAETGRAVRHILATRYRPAGRTPPRLPLLIGGEGARTLALAGRVADAWIAYGGAVANWSACAAAIRASAVRSGRAPESVACGVVLMLLDRQAQASAWRSLPSPGVGADPDRDAAVLRGYLDAGVTEFVICDHRLPVRHRPAALDRFAALCRELGCAES